MWNFTRNECIFRFSSLRRWWSESATLPVIKNTLETGWKDRKLHSKRVKKIFRQTSYHCHSDAREYVQEPQAHPVKTHSFRVYFHIFSTRFECTLTSSQLVSSVFSVPRLPMLPTPYLTGLTASCSQVRYSPLVLSVVSHFSHSFRVYFVELRNVVSSILQLINLFHCSECVVDLLHSFRV